MVAIGIILALRVWRETISRNDFFRLSRKPFVIGVAGDIGSGKSLFTDAIADLFGHHSTVTLSGMIITYGITKTDLANDDTTQSDDQRSGRVWQ
jgi:ABC-type dipeptide/oligopeptide/nickel transport system ATPase component